MRTLLLAMLLVTAASVVAAPAASACPEEPCDPPPMPLCPSVFEVDPLRPGWVREFVFCWL